jgi:hypothetical protein
MNGLKDKCICGLLALCLMATAACAVTIGWDAATGADGYLVYQGDSSRHYTNVVDAGTNTVLRLRLPDGDNFMAVTAYNKFGESDPSPELWFYASNPPPVTTVPLSLKVETSPDLFGNWTLLFSQTVTN